MSSEPAAAYQAAAAMYPIRASAGFRRDVRDRRIGFVRRPRDGKTIRPRDCAAFDVISARCELRAVTPPMVRTTIGPMDLAAHLPEGRIGGTVTEIRQWQAPIDHNLGIECRHRRIRELRAASAMRDPHVVPAQLYARVVTEVVAIGDEARLSAMFCRDPLQRDRTVGLGRADVEIARREKSGRGEGSGGQFS